MHHQDSTHSIDFRCMISTRSCEAGSDHWDLVNGPTPSILGQDSALEAAWRHSGQRSSWDPILEARHSRFYLI